MIRRYAAILIFALAAVPGVAAAQQYPPAATTLTIGDSTPGPGGTVSIGGGGFAPDADIVITFESVPVTLATVKASAAGVLAVTVKIPSNATPGLHTLKATGAAAGGGIQVLSAQVNVGGDADDAPGSGGTLARTGSSNNTIPIVLVAGGLVLVGGVLVFSVRRRRAPTT